MTTVSTTTTPGPLLTWGSAMSWSDQAALLRSWAESYSMIAYSAAIGESLLLSESIAKSPAISKSSTFAMSSAGGRLIGLNKSDGIAIAEDLANSVDFIRNFSETVLLADAVSKSLQIKMSEAFALVDAWRRQGDMVVSDMLMSSNGQVTMDDFINFMSFGNVPGYEEWRDFIPGDYEYREAMFRVVLESKNADRGILTNLQATVDVPDLIDRGTATVMVAETGALVTYNRTFHIVPEITLAARGGTGNPVAPEFNGDPTKDSFNVRLRDTVTGQFVTGSFTWAAHGY